MASRSLIPQEPLTKTPPRSSATTPKRMCLQVTPEFVANACPDCIRKDQENAALEKENRSLRKYKDSLFQQTMSLRQKIDVLSKKMATSLESDVSIDIPLVVPKSTGAGKVERKIRVGIDFDLENMKPDTFVALFGIDARIFEVLFEKLEPTARSATYWSGPKNTTKKIRETSKEQKSSIAYRREFLLFLMRLRQNVSVELLALIFGVSRSTVSCVFNTWIDLFSTQLEWIIKWTEQASSRLLIPPCIAKSFPRLRAIIDCTELFIQRPQSTRDQTATYSHYKHHNTIKIFVAILGCGAVGFISKAYGGRTSDNYIFKNCGFLELLSSGDQILADRGFTVDDELMRRGIELNTPPAGTGVVQFSTEDVQRAKRISNVRVHVERAIGRMKNYKILAGTLPLTVVPLIDKIVTSVAILVNFQDALID